jgi:hypothetical protein
MNIQVNERHLLNMYTPIRSAYNFTILTRDQQPVVRMAEGRWQKIEWNYKITGRRESGIS